MEFRVQGVHAMHERRAMRITVEVITDAEEIDGLVVSVASPPGLATLQPDSEAILARLVENALYSMQAAQRFNVARGREVTRRTREEGRVADIPVHLYDHDDQRGVCRMCSLAESHAVHRHAVQRVAQYHAFHPGLNMAAISCIACGGWLLDVEHTAGQRLIHAYQPLLPGDFEPDINRAHPIPGSCRWCGAEQAEVIHTPVHLAGPTPTHPRRRPEPGIPPDPTKARFQRLMGVEPPRALPEPAVNPQEIDGLDATDNLYATDGPRPPHWRLAPGGPRARGVGEGCRCFELVPPFTACDPCPHEDRCRTFGTCLQVVADPEAP